MREVPRCRGSSTGVCLACVWRVPGITGGRGWHDQREGAPPIKVDAPETKHLSLPVPFAHCLDQGAHHHHHRCNKYFASTRLLAVVLIASLYSGFGAKRPRSIERRPSLTYGATRGTSVGTGGGGGSPSRGALPSIIGGSQPSL